jgi:hypothetical protein
VATLRSAVKCFQQVRVKLERASLFHPDNARAALEMLHVRGMPSDLRPADRLNILNTMVSLTCISCVACCLQDIMSHLNGRTTVTCAPSSVPLHDITVAADCPCACKSVWR